MEETPRGGGGEREHLRDRRSMDSVCTYAHERKIVLVRGEAVEVCSMHRMLFYTINSI